LLLLLVLAVWLLLPPLLLLLLLLLPLLDSEAEPASSALSSREVGLLQAGSPVSAGVCT
jgi:hypothetical protein